MTRFYANQAEYVYQMSKKIEKKVDDLKERIVVAEQQVQRLNVELQELQEDCPHSTTYDNDRPTADEPSTTTCRACGFTQ